MIVPGTKFQLARVPIQNIVVTEHQIRYPEKVTHYFHRLLDNPGQDLDMIRLAPYNPVNDSKEPTGMYQILDGHHRYVAHILAGRTHVLALILVEPDWPGYDDALGVAA